MLSQIGISARQDPIIDRYNDCSLTLFRDDIRQTRFIVKEFSGTDFE